MIFNLPTMDTNSRNITVFYRDSNCDTLNLSTDYNAIAFSVRTTLGRKIYHTNGNSFINAGCLRNSDNIGHNNYTIKALVSGKIYVTNCTAGDLITARLVTLNSEGTFSGVTVNISDRADASGNACIIIPQLLTSTIKMGTAASYLAVQVKNNNGARGKIANSQALETQLLIEPIII